MAERSIAVLVRETAAAFERAGIDAPQLEARLLLQFVLAVEHSALILHWQRELDKDQAEHFSRLAARRLAREPLAYITGEREFWSLPFAVSPDVLIPRPETEMLLEYALRQVRAEGVRHALDLGCGSGVIAVVLARELGCAVTAVDRSQAALRQAAANAERHGVAGRITWRCGDFFAALPAGERFDLLLSNPPYVATREMKQLAPEVYRYEPHLALCGGEDGLDCITAISRQAGEALHPGAWIFLEIGATQTEAACRLFADSRHRYEGLRVLPDLAGRPRVLAARFAG